MKRSLALILALTMSCTIFVSCTEGDSSSSEKDIDTSSVAEPADDSSEAEESSDTDANSEPEESSVTDDSSEPGSRPDISDSNLMKLISDIIENGCATMKSSDGTFNNYITTDFNNVYQEYTPLYGVTVAALITADGDYYVLDTEGKRYYRDDTESFGTMADELYEELRDMLDADIVSSTVKDIDGEEYIVETYDLFGEMSYAFNSSGELCFYTYGDEFVPYTLSATVDSSKLSLEGYTEMTLEEYDQWWLEKMGSLAE